MKLYKINQIPVIDKNKNLLDVFSDTIEHLCNMKIQ